VAKLFESTQLNTLKLENRFVRSATFEGMAAKDGSCTQRLIDLNVALAKGGVGLIISGHSYVTNDGKEGNWRNGIQSDARLPGLRKMAQAIHAANGRMIIQLAHAGCHSSVGSDGSAPMGPSARTIKPGGSCREMTIQDIDRIVKAFGRAAVRAQQSGFDGVQIHAGHGYLLSQFLSPFYNQRKDSYGGSIENRARIILEVLTSVRDNTGRQFPIFLKINCDDFVENGLTMAETIQVCQMLETDGIDAIELSGGTRFSGDFFTARPGRLPSEAAEVYYREYARQYKEKLRVPLILVGGIRSFAVAEQLVATGLADYVALSRPLIREPDLVNRWKSGDVRKAACSSDNLCLEAARTGKGIYCVTAQKQKAEL